MRGGIQSNRSEFSRSAPRLRKPRSLLAGGIVLLVLWASTAVRAQSDSFHPEVVIGLLELILETDPASARGTLRTLRAKIQDRELGEVRLAELRPRLQQLLEPILNQDNSHELYVESVLLAASWGDATARGLLSELVDRDELEETLRAESLRLWLETDEYPAALARARHLLHDPAADRPLKQLVLQALGQAGHDEVAELMLDVHAQIEPALRARIIELLTRRAAWSRRLLEEIQQQRIPSSSLNANQVARLQASPDQELVELTRRVWGTVRTERNPERRRVIEQVRQQLASTPGNPLRGREVFRKVCANCHQIHGEGHDVGPDITRNGRGNLEQLLSNVLDPSLVIGAAYQGRIVVTADGQVLTGLVVEENDRRVVLKLPGGERESIPQEEIELMRVSELSLMPEGVEEQLTSQELVDLFAFLQLDKPPEDPTAQRIPAE